MRTALLQPEVSPTAVNKYIKHIKHMGPGSNPEFFTGEADHEAICNLYLILKAMF